MRAPSQADLDVESVVAVLQKGVLDAAYKALVGSAEDVAALERLRGFLDRWTRTKATRLVTEGRTTRRLKPEGVREEVWSELLKNYLFPALRHAVFEGAVAFMAEDGEWRFMAAVRRLPKRDRKRVRDAFARLDAADVDKSALTCVKWAFTSATVSAGLFWACARGWPARPLWLRVLHREKWMLLHCCPNSAIEVFEVQRGC